MKKIIIITAILLTQSLSAFGKVNGKGLICKCVECELGKIPSASYIENKKKPSEIGYYFYDDKVSPYYIKIENDEIFISKGSSSYYKSDLNRIQWEVDYTNNFVHKHIFILDRKTLLLEKKSIYNYKFSYRTLRNCNPFNGFKNFKKGMNELVLGYQNNYDLELKKNKF